MNTPFRSDHGGSEIRLTGYALRPFLPTGHLHTLTGMEASWLSLWPRRSNQALLHSMKTGMPCHTFPLPQTNNLGDLQEYASAIAAHEAQTPR